MNLFEVVKASINAQEAAQAYQKAIELDPKRIDYYRDLAQIYKKMGLEKEASQMEEKANQLRNNPPTS